MDELLTAYFDDRFKGAPEWEKSAFRRLLELPDPALIGYLLGGDEATDRELAHVIGRIRSGTRTG